MERGEVLGSTGTPRFAPVSTELAAVSPLLDERVVSTFIGGPDAGTQTHCHAGAFLNEDQEFPTEVMGSVTLPPTGVTEFTVPGLYRSDVEAVAGTPVQITPSTGDYQLIYAFDNGVNQRHQKAPEMQSLIFSADKLHGNGGHTHERNHDRENGEITDCFPNGVERLAQGGRSQDLPTRVWMSRSMAFLTK